MRINNERVFVTRADRGWRYGVVYDDELGITFLDQGYDSYETKKEAVSAAREYIVGMKRHQYSEHWEEVPEDEA